MPGRKRANPQRVDVVSAAKRQELFQFVPKKPPTSTAVDCADSANLSWTDNDSTASCPLTEINNSESISETAAQAGQVEKCVMPEVVPGTTREPFPAATPHHSVSLLHSKMTTSRFVVPIMVAKSNSTCADHAPSPVMFGELLLEPKAPCHNFDHLLVARNSTVVKTSLVCVYDSWFTKNITASYLKFEDGENATYLEVTLDYRLQSTEAWNSFRALFRNSAKAFLSCEHHGNENDGDVPVVKLELWALEKICEFDDPSEVARNTALSVDTSRLVEALYPEMVANQQERLIQEATSTSSRHLSIVEQMNKFYEDVQTKRGERSAGSNEVSIPGLTAELRGYQRRGVDWMIEKETMNTEVEMSGAEQLHPLHMLWKELPTIDHGLPYTVYFNVHSGRFTTRRFPQPVWPRGGILADEMGLGKTVEVLALVMSHKWSGPSPQLSTNQHEADTNGSDKAANQEEAMDVGSAAAVGAVETQEEGVANQPAVGVVKSKTREAAEAVGGSGCEEVQCICGAMKEDGSEREFVQCERCFIWQHSACVGFDSAKDVSFVCIRCLLKEPLPCGTTLIVSPQSIAQQWMEEINKHTEQGALKAFLYEGINRYRGYVSPASLASYDIVLVTYETLRNEFYHATSQEVSKNLRYRKRYVCYPSPLPAVMWWRVCLDEAQMVESTHAKAAEMMLKVSAVNRWCVTGTPVQRCLLDLHGLVLFLGVEPYKLLPWFQRLVWNPYLRGQESVMISLFSKIMWRSSKVDVAAELQLPVQSEEVHWLSFSSVEKYFYFRQKETCVRNLMSEMTSVGHDSATLSSLMNSTVTKLMYPLHSLRQACCHPSIVRNSYLPFNFSKKNVMTMPALLEKLTKHTKGQTRDALRRQVAAFNGLAGLYILKEEFHTAVEMYRAAMTVWQDHVSHDIECDRVQRIHTMENLSTLLADGYGRDKHTLRDDTLLQEAKELRSEFMKRSRVQVEAAEEAAIVCRREVEDAECEVNHSQARLLGEMPKEVEEQSEKSLSIESGSHETERVKEKKEGGGEMEDVPNGATEKQVAGSHDDVSYQPVDKESGAESTVPDGAELTIPDRAESTVDDGAEPSDCAAAQEKEPGHSETNQIEGGTIDSETTSRGGVAKVSMKRPTIIPSLPWWQSVNEWATDQDMTSDLVDYINAELASDDHYRIFRLEFTSMEGISLKLYRAMDQIKLFRDVVLSGLENLLQPPTPEFIEQVGACHIQRLDFSDFDDSPEERCDLCLLEDKTLTYAQQLFSHHHSDMWSHAVDGTQGVSDFEHIIKAMLSFIRHKGVPRQLIKSGQAVLSYVDALKKEYKALRKLWMALHEHFSDCDELRQAAHRIRFMTAIELMMGNDDIPFAVHPFMVDMHVAQCENDLQEAKADLRKHVGQLVYLQNLAKSPSELKEENTDPCLICTGKLGREWGVFTCGHPYCLDCILTLLQRNPATYTYSRHVTVRCPLCREPTVSSEINYIRSIPEDNADIDIKGSYSTKVSAVVKTLISIQQSDPGAKALVFSTWKEILDLIGCALSDNHVNYRVLVSSNKAFQSNLDEFKKRRDVNVLLLPFHSGSKGLNITEATHVLLVEPLMNVGTELQAIGRVHRMGQTKATFVHRFIIENTVEEKLRELLASREKEAEFVVSNESDSSLTVADIRSLVE